MISLIGPPQHINAVESGAEIPELPSSGVKIVNRTPESMIDRTNAMVVSLAAYSLQ